MYLKKICKNSLKFKKRFNSNQYLEKLRRIREEKKICIKEERNKGKSNLKSKESMKGPEDEVYFISV